MSDKIQHLSLQDHTTQQKTVMHTRADLKHPLERVMQFQNSKTVSVWQ
jgi:hypothetical protein